jgi:hypothetical protein
MRRRFTGGILSLLMVAAVGLTVLAAPTAGAYTSKAQYQIGFSENCDNPSFCGSQNLGGFWGWAQFNFDGTADAQLTGCSHLQGGGPAKGAQHFSADVPGWFIGSNGDFFITGEADTFTGRNGGPPVTVTNPFPPYPSDTGIPSAPGHYSAFKLFGFTPPPGVSIQIQVVKLG